MIPAWIVCVKQVPREPVFKRSAGFLQMDRDRAEGILNPDDRSALEKALEIRQRHGGKVVTVSMGPPAAEAVLRETLAAGADEAVLLSDPAFAGADTLATACTLAAGIRRIPGWTLILCGSRSLDSDTGQVGPQLAEFLDLPMTTRVVKLEVRKGEVLVERLLDGCRERLVMNLPALLTVRGDGRARRALSLRALEDSFGKGSVIRWGLKDLELDSASVGWEGSPTRAKEYAVWQRRRAGERIEAKTGEAVERILSVLADRNLLG